MDYGAYFSSWIGLILGLAFFALIGFLIFNKKNNNFKKKIKFIKHLFIPEKIDISGDLTRVYEGDSILVINDSEGIVAIINSTIIPIYYIEVTDVNGIKTIVEIRNFGFIGKMRRKIDSLDIAVSLQCCKYSLSEYPFVR